MEDKRLIHKCKRGNRQALRQIYEKYHADLLKLAIVVSIAWQDARWNGPRSMRLVFDPETKLLLSFHQWENEAWKEPASILMSKITYHETLPDHLFKLEIPPRRHRR